MTRTPSGLLQPSQPVAFSQTKQPQSSISAREPTAALALATRTDVEEYFAEDYFVDNHDYIYTAVRQ